MRLIPTIGLDMLPHAEAEPDDAVLVGARNASEPGASSEPRSDASLRWLELAERYLPERSADDPAWAFSRQMRPDEPNQGWKLHVAATVHTASDVLEACAPYLVEHDVLFKAAADLRVLARLNAGIFYGFSQVGKFITVYPRNAAAALQIAAVLDERTRGLAAPTVPYDLTYRPGGNVYYRYGGFRLLEVVEPDGSRAGAIQDPSGKLWTDRREPGHACPEWISNPFPVYEAPVVPQLRTDFLVYEALSQRGKGGVYSAVDIRATPARKCVLKEGRRHGETAVDGTDGERLIERERVALEALCSDGVPVPKVLGSFDVPGHRYLAIEYVEGTNLMALCSHPRVKLPLPTADAFAARVATLLAEIHASGWVWRDLKPLNLIVDSDEQLRPIDFEGAVPVDQPSEVPWGTPGYAPPELDRGAVTGTNLPEDLYALGVTIHQLYSSFIPVREDDPEGGTRPLPALGVARKGVHPGTREIVAALTDPDPWSRPSAAETAAELAARDASGPLAWRLVRRRASRRVPDPPAPPPGADRVVLRKQLVTG